LNCFPPKEEEEEGRGEEEEEERKRRRKRRRKRKRKRKKGLAYIAFITARTRTHDKLGKRHVLEFRS